MEIEVRHGPGFGVARCILGPHEQVRAEAGSMMACSGGMQLEASMEGGIAKSLKRSVLGGESLFVTTFTAPGEGGWVTVAPAAPGEVHELEIVDGVPWVLERGNWLASETSVKIDTKWKGLKSLVGGGGGFMVKASGHGRIAAGSYGAVEAVRLEDGEELVVDSGHVFAFQDSVDWTAETAARGSLANTLKSGEGVVLRFTGPGDVLVQTRSRSQLQLWLGLDTGSGFGTSLLSRK